MANLDLSSLLPRRNDVDFELNLNRHPKAHKDKSIVNALNMKLSDDGSILENDQAFDQNNIINTALSTHYKSAYYNIVHIIPTNKELVLFVKLQNANKIDIWRYREKSDKYNEDCRLFYNKGIDYHNGKYSSAFTYNSFDCLIIAFCEFDGTEDCPLSTINLGNFTDGHSDGYYWVSDAEGFDDRNLDTYKLPMCPEVLLPTIDNITITEDKAYLGWYYPYIRFKINKYDYTQWYSFGYPIINNFLESSIVFQNDLHNDAGKSPANNIAVDAPESSPYLYKGHFTSKLDIVNHCPIVNINFNQSTNIKYDYVQIGFVCISKTYKKYFRTSDIKYNSKITLEISLSNLIEEEINIASYYNYYNVKNIINKKNKIYIANYEESKNDYSNININDIKLSLRKTYKINGNDLINPHGYPINDTIRLVSHKFTKRLYFSPGHPGIKQYHYDESGNIQYDGYITKYYYPYENLAYTDINFYSIFILLMKLGIDYGDIPKTITIHAKGRQDGYSPYDPTTPITKSIDPKELYIGRGSNRCKFTSDVVEKALTDLTLPTDKEFRNNTFTDLYLTTDNSNNIFLPFSKTTHNRYDTENNKEYHAYHEEYEPNSIYFEINGTTYYLTDLLDKIDEEIDIQDFIDKNLRPDPILNSYNTSYISGLIPGEIYNFYIHFVDKYGEISDGYQLTNNSNIYTYSDGITKACIYKFKYNNEENYYALPADVPIINKNSKLVNLFISETENIKPIIKIIRIENNIIYGNRLTQVEFNEISDNFKYNDLKYLNEDITWSDLFDNTFNDRLEFINYTNSEGTNLFKIPVVSGCSEYLLGLDISDVNISNSKAVSWFISMEKLQYRHNLIGMGGKNTLQNCLINITNSYSGCNVVKILNHTLNYVDGMIKINAYESSLFKYFSPQSIIMAYAEDSQKKRTNNNSIIYFNQSFNMDYYYDESNRYNLKLIELMYLSRNVYTNTNKQLYRLGNIFTDNNVILMNGLNGRFCKNDALVFGKSSKSDIVKEVSVNHVSSDAGDTPSEASKRLYGDVHWFEIWNVNDGYWETAYLDKVASGYNYRIFVNGTTVPKYISNDIYYIPIDTLTMFNTKLNKLDENDIVIFKEHKNDDNLHTYRRTIYRSNVISDESKQNNWRFFETEAYKNIEENKGNITNILSIGTYLYVHTEHSLFAFSDDNSLQMNNQQLQVASPDIFDTEYKEQFKTILGYGGLQNRDAWIAGSFGYIYYNKDDKQIIKINDQSIDIISKTINEFLVAFNTVNILFANDVENDRVILKLISDTNDPIYISYNYKFNRFVSFHNKNINYDKAYNTKDKMYQLYTNLIYNIQDNNKFGSFKSRNGLQIIDIDYEYSVSFIINKYYYDIKYLEYITYKLRKRDTSVNNIDVNYYPVEQKLTPYSGNRLRVFNDCVDTEYLNILVTDANKNRVADFNKPYYELGNWHYNFLRDVLNSSSSKDTMSRLYGNYFIINFDFGKSSEHIEFEDLEVQVTEDNNR